jgi:hypothetical protein
LRYPIIFNPDFKELDKVHKDEIFEYLQNKIKRRRFPPYLKDKIDYALLTLKWATRIFQKSNIGTFTEFMLYCENNKGLQGEMYFYDPED